MRTEKPSHLENILREQSFVYEKANGGFKITGVKTDEVGKLAFHAGLPVLELANHAASLEDAFLELTEGTEEYQAHALQGDKK